MIWISRTRGFAAAQPTTKPLQPFHRQQRTPQAGCLELSALYYDTVQVGTFLGLEGSSICSFSTLLNVSVCPAWAGCCWLQSASGDLLHARLAAVA